MAITGAFIVPHPPLILPEVGRGQEKKIQKTIDACRDIARRIAHLKPDTIVLITPHSVMYADYFHISPGQHAKGNMRQFGVSDVEIEVEYDIEFVSDLEKTSGELGIPAGTLGEKNKSLDHAAIVPLKFINEEYEQYKLVRIGLSGFSFEDHYRFGKCIARTAENLDRRTVIVASGDMSHKLKADGPYGYAKEGIEFDREITSAMAEGDFMRFLKIDPQLCEAAGECGLRAFIIMAGAIDGKTVRPELLSYEGPFGVGYGVAAFEITGDSKERNFDIIIEQNERKKIDNIKSNEDPYVKLARYSLETYINTGKCANMPEELPPEMLERRAGVFVSIKKYGQLRGCIGTISAVTQSIAEEIMRNAVSAGTEDPRFSAVTSSELPNLVYSVDVLSEPETIRSLDELDVKKYGVIVQSGYKRGLLLPNLEGVDTVKEQVSIAKQKAGIKPEENCKLERFEVVRHK